MNNPRKTVLITGASGDIGMAITQKFAEEGYFVFAQGFSQTARLKAFSFDDVASFTADLTREEDIAAMMDAIEGFVRKNPDLAFPTVFVHAAGISHVGLMQEESPAEWDRLFQVNVRSAFLTAQKLVPHFLQEEQASIVFVSSFWGQLGASCEVGYSASKGALDSMTKALAKELGPSRIRVNAIALGAIDTRMNAWMSPKEKEDLCASIALGRMGTVREAAEAVYFFASDKASYFTGQIIRMDGSYLGA